MVIDENTFKEIEESLLEPLFAVDVSFETENTNATTSDNLAIESETFDWDLIFKTDEHSDKKEWHEIFKDKPAISIEDDPVSFSANFMEEAELEKMVLLENIAEMGDHRELPILYQLLEEESSSLILERVEELIQKFSNQNLSSNELFITEHKVNYSVFKEIFNLSDVETKIILLEEIRTIGDEKEIPLLESLLNNQNKKIAAKAKSSLQQINNRIEDQKISLSYSGDDSLFKLDFELDVDSLSKKEISSNNNKEGVTLFDQLCSKSINLYNKKNGW